MKFNADLEVLRKSVKAIEEMRPMFPVNEITDASVVMCKTAFAICKKYPYLFFFYYFLLLPLSFVSFLFLFVIIFSFLFFFDHTYLCE